MLELVQKCSQRTKKYITPIQSFVHRCSFVGRADILQCEPGAIFLRETTLGWHF